MKLDYFLLKYIGEDGATGKSVVSFLFELRHIFCFKIKSNDSVVNPQP